jgi:hypothetical protein
MVPDLAAACAKVAALGGAVLAPEIPIPHVGIMAIIRDPVGAEAVQLPTVTLEIKSGDCDDKVTLLSALLESCGHPTRFCAVKVDGSDRYSHVFLQTKLGKSWLSLETTEPWPPGQQSPRISGKMLVFYPR